jgi:hypothetical protein
MFVDGRAGNFWSRIEGPGNLHSERRVLQRTGDFSYGFKP